MFVISGSNVVFVPRLYFLLQSFIHCYKFMSCSSCGMLLCASLIAAGFILGADCVCLWPAQLPGAAECVDDVSFVQQRVVRTNKSAGREERGETCGVTVWQGEVDVGDGSGEETQCKATPVCLHVCAACPFGGPARMASQLRRWRNARCALRQCIVVATGCT